MRLSESGGAGAGSSGFSRTDADLLFQKIMLAAPAEPLSALNASTPVAAGGVPLNLLNSAGAVRARLMTFAVFCRALAVLAQRRWPALGPARALEALTDLAQQRAPASAAAATRETPAAEVAGRGVAPAIESDAGPDADEDANPDADEEEGEEEKGDRRLGGT